MSKCTRFSKKMPSIGAVRLIYAIMYIITALINTTIAISNAGVLRSLSEYAYLPFLRQIILTAPEFLFPLALWGFAVYQLTLAYLLLGDRYHKLGLVGGILFHLSIIPFGQFNLVNILIALPLAWELFIRRLCTSKSA